jgi:PAS domain S-box-containing protein
MMSNSAGSNVATSNPPPHASIEPPLSGNDQAYSNDHESLRALVEAAPALLHSARADGYIDFFNQGWLTFLGLPHEELCGWKWTQRFHPDDAGGFVAKWRAAIATGKPFETEGRVLRADGEYRILLHREAPVHDADGRITRWFGSSIDIEDQKRAEQSVRLVADTTPLCSTRAGPTDTWTTSTGAGWIFWELNCRKSRVGIGDPRFIPTMSKNW